MVALALPRWPVGFYVNSACVGSLLKALFICGLSEAVCSSRSDDRDCEIKNKVSQPVDAFL